MANKIKVAEKRKQVWTYYCEGLTSRDIAANMTARGSKMSHTMVLKYINKLLKDYETEESIDLKDIKQRAKLKLERLDQKAAAAFNKTDDDKKSMAKVEKEIQLRLKIHDRYSRLMGLDKIIGEKNNKEIDLSQFNDTEIDRIIGGEDPEKILLEKMLRDKRNENNS